MTCPSLEKGEETFLCKISPQRERCRDGVNWKAPGKMVALKPVVGSQETCSQQIALG
jgi:hypothetical protein